MFFLYYSKFDPRLYHIDGGTKSGGFNEPHYFGKYAFGVLPTSSNDMNKKTLYFYDAHTVPADVPVRASFTDLDGTTSITAVSL